MDSRLEWKAAHPFCSMLYVTQHKTHDDKPMRNSGWFEKIQHALNDFKHSVISCHLKESPFRFSEKYSSIRSLSAIRLFSVGKSLSPSLAMDLACAAALSWGMLEERGSHINAGAEFRLIRDAMDHAEPVRLPQGMDTPRGGECSGKSFRGRFDLLFAPRPTLVHS
ncbi:hypothetical protein TNCV_5070261 [Trichonephila clavipes]|nr:hypothetical protein TNCV_5070261 [Trichonephila clavipes]